MNKSYTVNWEDDEVKSVEVDGITYADAADIPDPRDRDKIMDMILDGPEAQPEWAEMASTGKPFAMEKLLLGIFAGIAALMLVITVVAALFTSRAIRREVTVPGQVVEMVVRSDTEGNDYYYPVVAFALPDGNLQRVELNQGSWPPAYEVGEAVNVAYDPQRPSRAHIRSLSGDILRWLVSGITGFLGLAFSAAAVMVYIVFLPRKKKRASAQ